MAEAEEEAMAESVAIHTAVVEAMAVVVATRMAVVGVTAAVGYAGLAPGSAGLYQVNLTIPTGVPVGVNSLNISGPDSYTSEATIPVAAATASVVISPVPLAVRSTASPLRRGAPTDRVVHGKHPDVRRQ